MSNLRRILAGSMAVLITISAYGTSILGCANGSKSSNPSSSLPQKDVIYYHTDHLGNSHLITDSQGNILREEIRYPYGLDRLIEEAGATTADYVYTGKEHDEETGLVYFGARYYSPEMGRWITPDPLFLKQPVNVSKRPHEGNLYAYVRNNPIRWIDVEGEAAGDPYLTQHAAAKSAIFDVNFTSINESQEYGGFIYKIPDDMYSYTSPVRGKSDHVDLGPLYSNLQGIDLTAYYHTHGSDNPNINEEIFSTIDITIAESFDLDAYLGTPEHNFLYYNHSTNSTYGLGSLLEDSKIETNDHKSFTYEFILLTPYINYNDECN